MSNNIIHLPPKCQEKFITGGDPLHATKSMCNDYCKKILNTEDSPWGRKSDPIKYFIKHGNTKLSLNQKKIINLLHKEYFSRGKACWLKRRNIIKQAKLSDTDVDNVTRTIKSLVNRGILLKVTGESKKQKVPFILPNIYSYSETNNPVMGTDTWIEVTDRGGDVSLYRKAI